MRQIVILTAAAVVVVASAPGCGLFVDLDGFTGGATTRDDGAPAPDASTEAGDSAFGAVCGDGALCAAAPPSGWTYAAIHFGAADGDCPKGYANGADLVEFDAIPNGTCDCTCGAPTTAGSCTTGTVTLSSGPFCSTDLMVSAASACVAGSVSANVRFTAPPVVHAKCTGTVGRAKPTPAVTSPARSCRLTAPPSQGSCGEKQRCVPAPTRDYGLCITLGGLAGAISLICPTGYSRRHTVASELRDTRSCAGCVCETKDTCDNARLELFDTECTGQPAQVVTATAGGRCASTPGAHGHLRYRVDHTPGTSCELVQEKLSGDLVPSGPITVCCPAP